MNIKDKYLNFYYETIGEIEEPIIDPKKTALLLVDLQNEFVLRDFGEALQFKAAGEWERWIPFHDRLDDIVIPNNKKLLDFFRANNMAITYGRIACLRDDGCPHGVGGVLAGYRQRPEDHRENIVQLRGPRDEDRVELAVDVDSPDVVLPVGKRRCHGPRDENAEPQPKAQREPCRPQARHLADL